MASPEERKEKINVVKDMLEELASVKVSELSRVDELSRDINFSDAVPYFEEMLDIIKQLRERSIDRLALAQINSIETACKQLRNLINDVRNFSLNQNTPADVCRNIIKQVANAYDGIMEPLTLPLAFTATLATDYAKIEREAKGYNATMRQEAETFKKSLDTYKTEAESALNAVKEQAAEAGVSTNAQIFLTDSEKHSDNAFLWLVATILMGIITLGVTIYFYIDSIDHVFSNSASAIQYILSKLILLSTLFFGIFWCSRNYKSSKHNETLNKHRANALMTFRAFAEGSSEQAIKEAILLQAAQAAFINRPTGYESLEKDMQSANPVVEMLGKSLSNPE